MYLGEFNNQKLYAGTIDGGLYHEALVIRTDTTTVDFEFCISDLKKLVSPLDYALEVKNRTLLQVVYYRDLPEIGIPRLSETTNIQDGFKAVFTENESRFSEPDISTHIWKWNGKQFELTSEKTINPYQEELRKYRSLLKEGKLYEAIVGAPMSDPTAHGFPCYPIYEELIAAAYPIIMREFKKGNKFAAASMALLVLEKEDLVGSCRPEDLFFTFKSRHLSSSPDGTPSNYTPVVTFPVSEKNVTIVNDLAFIIQELNPCLTTILLKQVIEFYPERTVAYLNLADVLYVTNYNVMNEEILKKYRSYVQQMTQKGHDKKIPDYVADRISAYTNKN